MTAETVRLHRSEQVRVVHRGAIPPAQFTSAHFTRFEPNFGADDMHAIKAIAYIMNGIFCAALLMYAAIAGLAWFGV